jgi:SAM-dependent methyltransferase
MSGFSASWLALREPYDRRARNADVLQAVTGRFGDQSSIAVVDLGCGTGATLRAISPHLPAQQNWRLVDNDLSLLAHAAGLARPPKVSVAARTVDLVRDLELALDGPADLVTTSALLDLVSQDWLDRLAIESAARRLPVYAALTYQGRVELAPTDALDEGLIAAVNRHQHTDKGFGPALGPDAVTRSVKAFEKVGYAVLQGSSDWLFEQCDRAIQIEILKGWAGAAAELEMLASDRIEAWLTRRCQYVEAGRSTMRIGHVDIFAEPRITAAS